MEVRAIVEMITQSRATGPGISYVAPALYEESFGMANVEAMLGATPVL